MRCTINAIHRLPDGKLRVTVDVPDQPGDEVLDELSSKAAMGAGFTLEEEAPAFELAPAPELVDEVTAWNQARLNGRPNPADAVRILGQVADSQILTLPREADDWATTIEISLDVAAEAM